MNVRKQHNDKFDSKKRLKSTWILPLRFPLSRMTLSLACATSCVTTVYFKDLQSVVVLKLNAELKVSFPAYLDVFSKATTQTSLKLLESYPLAADMLAAPKDELVETIRCTARKENTAEKSFISVMFSTGSEASFLSLCYDYATKLKESVRHFLTADLKIL